MADGKLIAAQDFVWNDAGRGARYTFGRDGYLAMDGSEGSIRCSRAIDQTATRRVDTVGLRLRVALGQPYRIAILDASGVVLCGCGIDQDGRLCSVADRRCVSPGRSLTFHYGKPFEDAALRPAHVVPSDEHRIRFQILDEGATVQLDDLDPVPLAAGSEADQRALRIELESEDAGPGCLILLREYAEYNSDECILQERFPIYWNPVGAPSDGAPDDNVCDTTIRPAEDRWLETTTAYGYVKARIQTLVKGAVEFEMKTDDATRESCLILEEHQGVIKYGNIQLGLLRGEMVLCSRDGINTFDRPIEVANDRVYRIRVAWDAPDDEVRMWVDGEPVTSDGVERFTFANPTSRGIDTITLHPGDAAARPSLMQKQQGVEEQPVEPLKTCWGRFRIYDLA